MTDALESTNGKSLGINAIQSQKGSIRGLDAGLLEWWINLLGMKRKDTWMHVALWCFMVLFIFDYHWFDDQWQEALVYSLGEVATYMFLFYVSATLYQRFKHSRSYLVLTMLGFVIAYIAFMRITGYEAYFYEMEAFRNVISMGLNASLYCGLAVLFGVYQDSVKLKQKNAELAYSNRLLQLENLKEKLNPHFIFNSLNNLNALIVKSDKRLPDFIEEFSSLLRYSVDEGMKDMIPLRKEVACIQSYFRLLKMNDPAASDIDLYVEGILEGRAIAPFIITSLVENAIKHSDIRTNKEGHLHCEVSVDSISIKVTLSNSMKADQVKNRSSGLNMIKRQLELRYGSGYELVEKQNEGTYETALKIQHEKTVL